MSEKINLSLLTETPPATDVPASIDFDRLAEGLRHMETDRLMKLLVTIVTLCNGVPEPPVH
jgi:hypothetical protein